MVKVRWHPRISDKMYAFMSRLRNYSKLLSEVEIEFSLLTDLSGYKEMHVGKTAPYKTE